MGWFETQKAALWALLWKNLCIRKKTKMCTITELTFPASMGLCIYLLLMKKHYIDEDTCYWKAKAMPTAGGMVFLQTLLCAANNTCDTLEKSDFKSFDSSAVSMLGEEIKKSFNIKSRKKREDDFMNWIKDFYAIESLIEAIQNQNEKWKLLYNVFLRSNIYSETSEQEMQNIKKLSRVKKSIYKSKIMNSLFRPTDQEEPQLEAFDVFFCGPDMTEINEELLAAVERDLPIVHRKVQMDVVSHDINEDCKRLIYALDNSKYQAVMEIFKPLLIGKVIYTPDVPVVNKMMDRIKESFQKVKKAIESTRVTTRMWREIRTWNLTDLISKYKNEENILKEAVNTKTGRTILKYFEKGDKNSSKENRMKRRINKFIEFLNNVEKNFENYLQSAINMTIPIAEVLGCLDFDRFIAVDTESSALRIANKYLERQRLWGYVSFTNVPDGAENLPSSVSYTLRAPAERMPATRYKVGSVNTTESRRSPLKFHPEIIGGTAYLQNLIEGEIIRELTGRKFAPGIYLRQMHYPCYKSNLLENGALELLKQTFAFGWIVFFCRIVKKVVVEKEMLFKEILMVFGIRSYHHWLAFFVDNFIFGAIASAISALVFWMALSGAFIFFFFQLAFVIATICFAFMISTFFRKASYCTILASMVYCGLYTISGAFEGTEPIVEIITCLISITALQFGIIWIINMKKSGMELSLSNIDYAPDGGSYITMQIIIIMLLVDSVIYMLLTIYFENILSSSSRLPCYYCFLPSYWKKLFGKSDSNAYADAPPPPEPESSQKKKKRDSKNFEKDPEGLRPGIEVINVTKEYGSFKNKVKVVNNLSLTFFENQITSFLGHNGAGKSTTVGMMIGVIPITKGSIRIYGADVQKDRMRALRNVGICMQENVLLPDLSVKDHMKLIGKLKNLPSSEVDKNINELLQAFEMQSRAEQAVKQLSGGWKRKVCVAMAFMGGSRTIFLDEPTAGIDPFARRSIWEVLIKLKEGRTIVLITHHLDEADLLGDRIAIIAAGEVKCCGSSAFLKAQCNKSYILTIDSSVRPDKPVKKSKNNKKVLSAQAQEMLSVVKSAIGGSELEEERGNEYIFSLPPKQTAGDLNRLFEAIEKNKKRLNISSYGVSAISLEEVFLKVLEKAENEEQNRTASAISVTSVAPQKAAKTENETNISRQSSKEAQPIEETLPHEALETSSKSEKRQKENEVRTAFEQRQKEKLRARRKFWNHFVAILILRFIHVSRNYIFVIFQIFGPLLFPLFLFIMFSITKVGPSLTADISLYESSVIFYSNDKPSNSKLTSYENSLLGPYGVGTKCIRSPGSCSMESIPAGSIVGDKSDIGSCDCDSGDIVCTNRELPSAKMSTGHTLYNLTGLDLDTWLISTEKTFKLKRIGGFTFGHYSPLTSLSNGDFVRLFSEKKLFDTLTLLINANEGKVDAKKFTSAIMSGMDKSKGQQIFKDVDGWDNIIVWFNSGDKLGSMALMNGVSNLVLRASLPKDADASDYAIKLTVHPLEESINRKNETNLMTLIVCLIMSLAFLFASFCIYLVNESKSGMKNLQVICGITPIVYWFVTFVWDLIIFSIHFCLVLLLLLIFHYTQFYGKYSLPVFVAASYTYALTTLLFVYLCSRFFNLPSNAFLFFVLVLNINIITVVPADQMVKMFFDKDKYEIVEHVLLIFPEFAYYKCLSNVAAESAVSEDILDKLNITLFQWDLSTRFIVRMLYNAAVYLLFILIMEYRNVHPLGLVVRMISGLKLCCRSSSGKSNEDDDDVAAEKDRVLSGKAKDEKDLFIMKNLTKIYCGQMNPAVNEVCVGIKHGECLGLLGMNGAGKTTIFKMIAGDVTPTKGDAIVAGRSMKYKPAESRVLLSYCPQMTALDAYLTPREHLNFFCRIRGLDKNKRTKEVDSMIELMNLGKHKNKLSKNLSGGNQRKLNAAIALLCDPEVILLDEPTAGMDVMARRFLWGRILQAMQDGRSVILTTHSMEECQALATQVCIMFKGRFECFGSTQHLKNKFNEGYIVTVRLVSADKAQEFTKYLDESLPGSTIMSAHSVQMVIKIHPDTSVAKAISNIGEAKRKQLIEDFSISQTTLETVFLKLIGTANREQAYQKSGVCGCL